MTDFKSDIEKAIENGSRNWWLKEKNNSIDAYKAGANFLLPVLLKAVKDRNKLIKQLHDCEWDESDLLEMLEGK